MEYQNIYMDEMWRFSITITFMSSNSLEFEGKLIDDWANADIHE